MTLDYYVGELRELVNKMYDDNKLDDRLLIRWINTQRALWIKNQLNKEYVLDNSVSQTIKCLGIEVKSGSECSFIDSNSRFLVSERIPSVIEFNKDIALLDVRVPELLGYSITIVRKDELKYKGNGRLTQDDLFGSLIDNKIYIKLPANNYKAALLTNISIDAIFDNPLQLNSYTCCNNEPCFDSDRDDYPISDALWEYMVGNIINNKLAIKLNAKEDEENNENSSS